MREKRPTRNCTVLIDVNFPPSGTDSNGTPLYGKWENQSSQELPLLDACGAHYGFTPESPDTEIYHHHVQANPPFTYGCFGPNDDGSLVTVEHCREIYDDCEGDLEGTLPGFYLFCPKCHYHHHHPTLPQT